MSFVIFQLKLENSNNQTMIRKRQNWSDQENDLLIKIMNDSDTAKIDTKLKWETISTEMFKNGFQKTAKQCRERLT